MEEDTTHTSERQNDSTVLGVDVFTTGIYHSHDGVPVHVHILFIEYEESTDS